MFRRRKAIKCISVGVENGGIQRKNEPKVDSGRHCDSYVLLCSLFKIRYFISHAKGPPLLGNCSGGLPFTVIFILFKALYLKCISLYPDANPSLLVPHIVILQINKSLKIRNLLSVICSITQALEL